MKKTWNQPEAVALCTLLEGIAPNYGCHVALTGGLLYKGGERKDADIMFYRIRQVERIDTDGLFAALAKVGLVRTRGHGWVHKAKYEGKDVDLFFPEEKLTGENHEYSA